MNLMKDVLWIVIHCSYTKASQKVTVEDLDIWHQAKGWACCGYHWVIYQDGSIHSGRAEKFAGAHVLHYNQHAIGVCYIGGMDDCGRDADTRTPEQKAALWFLLKELKQAYPQARIVGHRDMPKQRLPIELVQDWLSRDDIRQSQFSRVAKTCPLFDARTEYASLNSDL